MSLKLVFTFHFTNHRKTYSMTHHRTDNLQPRPYLLINKIRNYAWGSRGQNAFIPKFTGIKVDKNKAYAEMWMGAHPSAPSTVKIDGKEIALSELINDFPEKILGKKVKSKFSGKLPFLLKVLSARQALSIQAHPNKTQAVHLHRDDPEHYPDDNHKPEIAIALDSLTALVGFKSIVELSVTFEKYPEISFFISSDNLDKFKNGIDQTGQHHVLLKEMYSRYIQNAINLPQKLAQATDELEQRLRSSKIALTEEDNLFLEQKNQYDSDDVGLFSIFLLNLIHLKKGQGIFLDAGIPHAYIKGNIIECMANSDNVVRAGLTTKFKDVHKLVDILTYESGLILVINDDRHSHEMIYEVPISEFEITRWNVSAGQKKEQFTNQSPQVLLITEGEIELYWENGKQTFSKGKSILIPACLEKYSIFAENSSTIFKVAVPV